MIFNYVKLRVIQGNIYTIRDVILKMSLKEADNMITED